MNVLTGGDDGLRCVACGDTILRQVKEVGVIRRTCNILLLCRNDLSFFMVHTGIIQYWTERLERIILFLIVASHEKNAEQRGPPLLTWAEVCLKSLSLAKANRLLMTRHAVRGMGRRAGQAGGGAMKTTEKSSMTSGCDDAQSTLTSTAKSRPQKIASDRCL